MTNMIEHHLEPMGINYTILKSSIINSSIWNEDAETCKVWVTMMALRNKDGEIYASIGGLAHQARISPEKTRESVTKFLLPESDSSSRDDGRRIVEIQGGWKLLNHERIQEEARRANKAVYQAAFMRKQRRRENLRKSMPLAGENEFVKAVGDGATNEQLDEILEKYATKKTSAGPIPAGDQGT